MPRDPPELLAFLAAQRRAQEYTDSVCNRTMTVAQLDEEERLVALAEQALRAWHSSDAWKKRQEKFKARFL